MVCAFKKMEEKLLSSAIVQHVWSPKLDLIVMANVQAEVRDNYLKPLNQSFLNSETLISEFQGKSEVKSFSNILHLKL